MKKLLLCLVLAIPLIAFTACGGDDEPDPNNSGVGQLTNQTIAGVWENGDKFISFTQDGFYCTYVAEDYIASGTYTISKNIIKCNNAYYGTEMSINLSDFDSQSINGKVSYVDYEGNTVENALTFRKSDKAPTDKENILIGKSYTALVSFNGTNKRTTVFNTYNTGEVSMPKNPNSMSEILRKDIHYVYLAPKVYYQAFKPKTAGLSSFYENCNNGYVSIQTITIGSDGQISKID